jgi:hypothetical protein
MRGEEGIWPLAAEEPGGRAAVVTLRTEGVRMKSGELKVRRPGSADLLFFVHFERLPPVSLEAG